MSLLFGKMWNRIYWENYSPFECSQRLWRATLHCFPHFHATSLEQPMGIAKILERPFANSENKKKVLFWAAASFQKKNRVVESSHKTIENLLPSNCLHLAPSRVTMITIDPSFWKNSFLRLYQRRPQTRLETRSSEIS